MRPLLSKNPALSDEQKNVSRGAIDRRWRHVVHACETCRVKKRRCTGERPTCRPCEDKKEDCNYGLRRKDDCMKRDLHALKDRVEVLENFLRRVQKLLRFSAIDCSKVLDELCDVLEKSSVSNVDLDDDEPYIENNETRSTSLSSLTPPAHNTSGSYKPILYSSLNILKIALHEHAVGTPPSAPLSPKLLSDTFEGADTSSFDRSRPLVVLRHIPHQSRAKAIVDVFFEDVHPLFPALYKSLFVSQIDEMYSSGDKDLNRISDTWFAVFKLVLAIGEVHIDRKHNGRNNDRGNHHYVSAASSGLLDPYNPPETIDLRCVQVALLGAVYQLCIRNHELAMVQCELSIRRAKSFLLDMPVETTDGGGRLGTIQREIRHRIGHCVEYMSHTIASFYPRTLRLPSSQFSAENLPDLWQLCADDIVPLRLTRQTPFGTSASVSSTTKAAREVDMSFWGVKKDSYFLIRQRLARILRKIRGIISDPIKDGKVVKVGMNAIEQGVHELYEDLAKCESQTVESQINVWQLPTKLESAPAPGSVPALIDIFLRYHEALILLNLLSIWVHSQRKSVDDQLSTTSESSLPSSRQIPTTWNINLSIKAVLSLYASLKRPYLWGVIFEAYFLNVVLLALSADIIMTEISLSTGITDNQNITTIRNDWIDFTRRLSFDGGSGGLFEAVCEVIK